MEARIKERLYEVEFESLKEKDIEAIENKTPILNSKLDVTVTIGSCKKSIKDILSFKEGDIIHLNKIIDEDLDVNINNKCIATGETIKVDDRISIRINEFK